MHKYILSIAVGGSLLAAVAGLGATRAADHEVTPAQFASDGQAMLPQNWRRWVYIGTPLTPNALNDGAAPFPEFHNVYIEPSAYAHW